MMEGRSVWLGWNGADMPADGATDPRHPDLGWRWIGADGTAPDSSAQVATTDEWQAVRIAAGVPQGPIDLQPERALMLEAGLDRLGAVDFEKGCYVGQEVTARTHYRGLVKRRIVPLAITGGHPGEGSDIHEGDKVIGRVLSHVDTGNDALCLAAMKLSDLHRLMEGHRPMEGNDHPYRGRASDTAGDSGLDAAASRTGKDRRWLTGRRLGLVTEQRRGGRADRTLIGNDGLYSGNLGLHRIDIGLQIFHVPALHLGPAPAGFSASNSSSITRLPAAMADGSIRDSPDHRKALCKSVGSRLYRGIPAIQRENAQAGPAGRAAESRL